MNGPGIQLNKKVGANQPPRKKMEIKLLISSIVAYSPKKNSAKPMALYSTL